MEKGKSAAEESVAAAPDPATQPGESCRMRAYFLEEDYQVEDNSNLDVPLTLGTLKFRQRRYMSSCEFLIDLYTVLGIM